MTTRRAKSTATKLLEKIAGGALTFGALLRSIREGEEETQVEFAERLGLSRSHLCDIEKGRKQVSPARAAAFAETLGYDSAQFVRLALQDQILEAGLSFEVTLRPA